MNNIPISVAIYIKMVVSDKAPDMWHLAGVSNVKLLYTRSSQ